jgi:hypothetical protein
MKNVIIYSLLFTLTSKLWAQETPTMIVPISPYTNIREGNSRLIPLLKADIVTKLYNNTKALVMLKSIIQDKSINRCASKIIAAIKNQLNLKYENEIELAILGLRLNDSIDDVAAGILIKANTLARPFPPATEKSNLSDMEEARVLKIFTSKAIDIHNKDQCIEDTYRTIVTTLGITPALLNKQVIQVNQLAADHNLITTREFNMLEALRVGKVLEWPLTLSQYATGLEAIVKSFPNRTKESSDLSIYKNTNNMIAPKSLRQSLYERYSSAQIILLANMVHELNNRLDSKEITIRINYVDQESEVIYLSPMEKFRFILKYLRKELALLNNGSLLNGNPANYLDLITASYEVGYISASEITQLTSLEEIWNPKKSGKEKALAWGERFGSLASILLPPPFGFVSLMTIMLIDHYTAQLPVHSDSDFNIF